MAMAGSDCLRFRKRIDAFFRSYIQYTDGRIINQKKRGMDKNDGKKDHDKMMARKKKRSKDGCDEKKRRGCVRARCG